MDTDRRDQMSASMDTTEDTTRADEHQCDTPGCYGDGVVCAGVRVKMKELGPLAGLLYGIFLDGLEDGRED